MALIQFLLENFITNNKEESQLMTESMLSPNVNRDSMTSSPFELRSPVGTKESFGT